jgi:hypothetical protein
MKIDETLKTYVWNTCKNTKKHLKPLQTYATFR